jgi:cyclic beta-1,2-glucan synthetase
MMKPHCIKSAQAASFISFQEHVMRPHEEMFGATRLAEHAQALARSHTVAPPSRPSWIKRREHGPLLTRLEATKTALIAARDTLARASAAGADVSPAGAWLLDNFFVVLEQVPEIRATLPPEYYQELPKLAGQGALVGYPRIYEIIIELIAHTDGRLDEPSVARMIAEYQRVTPLTMGELWAIPAMLRLGYLDNVRRMALRAARDVADRALADEWAARLLTAESPEDATGGLWEFVHDGPALSPSFLTRFLQQIRSRRSDFTPLLWLEQWVAEDVMSVETAAQLSVHELALTQLVISNSIASLRSVASIDWTGFVETASATEVTLRDDPSGVYTEMTRATRDRYRHAVERIAKGSGRDEPDIAAGSIDAARAAARGSIDERRSHIGYYLVGEGRRAFERSVGYRRTLSDRIRDWVCARPGLVYFGGVAIATTLALAALTTPLWFAAEGSAGAGLVVLALALTLLPALDAAIAVVHQLVPLIVSPARLPRLDFARAVPEGDRTAVVVPLLFGTVDAVAHALEHIEVQYLANRDPQIRFALLSDFLDASSESAAGDDEIVAAAIDGIRALNMAYAGNPVDATDDAPYAPPFYLLHRPRRWNAPDATWMGWERKRGKLVDFNSFIRGADDRVFSVAEGDLPWLRDVRFPLSPPPSPPPR